MTLIIAQFRSDPKIVTLKLSIPQLIFISLRTLKNIELQNLSPKNIGQAYEYKSISEHLPPPW